MKLAHAKQLRAGMTDAERRLWYHLRAHRFGGSKFKRQVPIGRYIVDFVCFDRKVIVEVDGGQHAMSVSDQARDEWLRGQGFRVLRFWNHDVLKSTEAVLTRILETVSRADRYPSPDALRASPSPTDLGFTRDQHYTMAQVGYIRLGRGEGSNDQRSGQS